VPLSEEELRLLEQMERALVAEDPKLASTLRGKTLRSNARRRSFVALGVFVLGVAVLMTGAVTTQTWLGITGFVVMLASSYVALVSWRGQDHATASEHASGEPRQAPEGHPSLRSLDGGKSSRGKAKKRGSRGPRQRSARSHQSMMQRFEERWRRRREQNGGL